MTESGSVPSSSSPETAYMTPPAPGASGGTGQVGATGSATFSAGRRSQLFGRWRERRRSGAQQTAWTDIFDQEYRERFVNPTRRRLILALGAIIAAIAIGIIFANDPYYLRRFSLVFIGLTIACGLNVLVGHAGQVSLGHAALYATGGYAAAWLTTYAKLPPLLGLPVGLIVGALAGLLIGAPALRVRGAYLALATMAFGLIVFKITDSLRQTAPHLATVEPPSATLDALPLDPDQQLYFLGLAMATAIVWITRSLTWSHIGRSAMAVAGSEDGAASVGISVYKTKLGAFVLAASTAGLAGAFYNYVDQLVNPSTFDPVLSTRFLFVLVIGGLGTAISGPFVGAGLIFVLQLFAERFEQAENLVLAAVLLGVVWFLPRGIAGTLGETRLIRLLPRPYETYTVLSRSPRRMVPLEGPEPLNGATATDTAKGAPRAAVPNRTGWPVYTASRSDPSTAAAAEPGGYVLIVENISKRYGGVVAVDDVSLAIPQGAIHALMGPNGSGKTTCLDIIAGKTQPDKGRVILNGADVTKLPPHERFEAGLARTFQNIQLFPELPVIWNIAAAVRPRTWVLSQLLHTPKCVEDEIRIHGKALEILEEWGLTYLTFRKAGVCSYGQQKMIELARAAASNPSVLLVDEPSTGLNPKWIELMVEALAKLNQAGTTLLIIEHHQAVISDLASEVTVLDGGRVIARGTFDEVRANPEVQRVYLGESYTEQVAIPAVPQAGTATPATQSLGQSLPSTTSTLPGYPDGQS
jgi:branched-chain amino acid transport system permease protein